MAGSKIVHYPASLMPDAEGFCILFVDFPECGYITGATIQQAVRNAVKVLDLAMDTLRKQGCEIPKASEPLIGQYSVPYLKVLESRNFREGRFDATNNNFYRRKFSRRKQRRLPRKAFRPIRIEYVETFHGTAGRSMHRLMEEWAAFVNVPPPETLEIKVKTEDGKVVMHDFSDVILTGNGVDEILKHANGESKEYVLRMGYPIPPETVQTTDNGLITLTVSFDANAVQEANATAVKEANEPI